MKPLAINCQLHSIVSFYTANPENDGKRVQEFFLTMEAAIREHPLWAGATDEEIDSALEVLIILYHS